MAAAHVQTSQGHYFKVLESHKKKLGDYEQVHFRKNSIPATENLRYEMFALAPRRASRPHLVVFDKNTAATYLRQTETQWLMPSLSRQDAAKLLFNKPTGTFVVRNSQKARYALTLRMPVDDPAVNHFLIQTNQQNFLTIQGSNLPFLSIYDLLAYFCFHQSGGMPCCLKPPVSQIQDDSSDSSDSDPDEPQPYSVPTLLPKATPPTIPPKSPRNITGGNKQRKQSGLEEIFINSFKQFNGMTKLSPSKVKTKGESASVGGTPEVIKKRIPPPKPPRTDVPLDYEPIVYEEEDVELYRSARRVSSLVDMDLSKLYMLDRKPPTPNSSDSKHWPAPPQQNGTSYLPPPSGPVPAPSLVNRRIEAQSPALILGRSVDSALNTPSGSPKVLSLINMFEAKSPPPSPPLKQNPPTKLRKSPHSARKLSTNRPDNAPTLPPRPQPPPLPPRPMLPLEGGTPMRPPRTPAPVVPPKPQGFTNLRKHSLRRSQSDSRTRRPAVSSRTAPKFERGGDVPPRPTSRRSEHQYEAIEFLGEGGRSEDKLATNQNEGEGHDREAPASNSTSPNEEPVEGGGSVTSDPKGSRWGALPAWAKKLKLHRKPRKKIRKFIIALSADQGAEFGRRISEFIADMKSHSMEPHQKMLSEIRNFITQMHEFLLSEHKSGLINCGMESCDNFGHVVETTLQQVILHPLSHYIYLRIEEYYSQNGFLFQVQRSIHQGRLKQPEEMGIRKNLLVPGDKAVSELTEVFSRMMKTPCAISKLEYLLEAVRLTYENVRDSKAPKKSMNDLGADDFLPLFVWVLVQCGFYRAEIEAEYMWGLAHPSLFNGEGGYYLTTLTSAVNVLKELSQAAAQTPVQAQLPTMNEMQTELKVYCEDEHTGQYSSAFYLPIVPTMSAAEICETIASRRRIPTPEKYALFTVINGKSTMIEDGERPQEIKLRWTLDKTSVQCTTPGSAYQPSSRFIAYKLRTPVS